MTDTLFSLAGRVALVTGASRGLGFEIATAFAEAGAHVLVNSRSAERCTEVADDLVRRGLKAEPLPLSISDESAARIAIAGVAARLGRLDILVQNVGARLRAPLDEISTEAFRQMLTENVAASFMLTKLAAGPMAARGWGRIIMLTSLGGTLARAGDAAYISAKAGLTGLMRAFACEYGPKGITCNAIAPGPFATESNTPMPQIFIDRINARVPLGRIGRPQEIAGPALFLASEASSYVNGHVLTVDGGYSIAF
ncbi:MAG TPA: SDR family oxidoreductase [Alphaproteobacteria bacterium]|nr:SDR family oxidoreductase [Alphaproteobacteria bacterium]